MKDYQLKLIVLLFLLFPRVVFGQNSDTIRIKPQDLNAKVLREGTHRYLVYFKMGENGTRIQTQFWTRTIKKSEYNGKSVIEINQEWEDKDSILHVVKSISDGVTMEPFYHETWWKVQASRESTEKTVRLTTVDFLNNTVTHNGVLLNDSITDKQPAAIWAGYKSSIGQFHLNWHLDLETFPILPYRNGVTFLIPFYDPGTASGLKEVAYTVTGSKELIGYDDQKIDCWILVHESKGNKEVFWISKKTKEVLKLEQQINGTMYRYKLKFGFSV